MLHGLAVQGVQHGMACPVCSTGTPVRLAPLPVVQGLPSKRSLVDLAILRPREWQAVILQLPHGSRGLSAHVLDRILYTDACIVLGTIAERISRPWSSRLFDGLQLSWYETGLS